MTNDKVIRSILERKANALIRTDYPNGIAECVRRAGGHCCEYFIFSNEEISRVEGTIEGILESCRKEGGLFVLLNAGHMSGMTMYRIWQALTDAEGCHPDFHIILQMREEDPIEHLDRIFKDLFAVLNGDGTFYREG